MADESTMSKTYRWATRLIDAIDVEVLVVGDLSGDQRMRLLEIAGKCPVHRTLTSSIQIRTRPAAQSSDALAWE